MLFFEFFALDTILIQLQFKREFSEHQAIRIRRSNNLQQRQRSREYRYRRSLPS